MKPTGFNYFIPFNSVADNTTFRVHLYDIVDVSLKVEDDNRFGSLLKFKSENDTETVHIHGTPVEIQNTIRLLIAQIHSDSMPAMTFEAAKQMVEVENNTGYIDHGGKVVRSIVAPADREEKLSFMEFLKNNYPNVTSEDALKFGKPGRYVSQLYDVKDNVVL